MSEMANWLKRNLKIIHIQIYIHWPTFGPDPVHSYHTSQSQQALYPWHYPGATFPNTGFGQFGPSLTPREGISDGWRVPELPTLCWLA